MWSRRLVGWQDGRRRRDGAKQDALRSRVRAPMRTQRADESSAPHCVPASSCRRLPGYSETVTVSALPVARLFEALVRILFNESLSPTRNSTVRACVVTG